MASPAIAWRARSCRYRRATTINTPRECGRQASGTWRIAQELDEARDFFLSLVAAGHIGEGDRGCRLVRGIVRLALAEREGPPLPPPASAA